MSKARIFTNNWFDPGSYTSLASSSAAVGFPITNISNYARRSKVWRSTGCTSEYIKIDLGTSGNPQALVIIGTRDKPFPLTESATVTLQGNATDSWGSPAYSHTVTLDQRALVLSNAAGLHSSPLRFWRIVFADSTNPLGYIEVAKVFLGTYWEPVRGSLQFPFKFDYVDYSKAVQSEGGQSFANIKSQTVRISTDWFGLTVAEKEVIDAHYEKVGIGKPFFVQLDPDLAYSTSIGIYTKYVRFDGTASCSLTSPGVFSLQADLIEDL